MSMILDKRNEVADKLNRLLNERQANIDLRVNSYREQLEAQPLSDEIVSTKKLLAALDEVISCESLIQPTQEEVEVKPIVEVAPETIISNESISETNEEITPIDENQNFVIFDEPISVPVEEEPVIDVQEELSQPEVVKTEVEARPGMAYVNIPERS